MFSIREHALTTALHPNGSILELCFAGFLVPAGAFA